MSNTNGTFTYNRRQQLYVRHVTATLIDLVVLGLFTEYWDAVVVNGFSILLLASIVLQITMQIALGAEHAISGFVLGKFKPKNTAKVRLFTAWATLFVSKLAILELLSFLFSDDVRFLGIWHGVIPFLTVVFTMVGVEALFRWIYFRLSGEDPMQFNEEADA
jgi:hypothetical protein